ncbi:MAG: hypothetical protein R2801_11110, partial [Chitinophagales bacterium]
PTKEAKQGQIAITIDDFILLPEVYIHPDKIEYIGKNSLKQDLLRYSKKIDESLLIIEALRVSKRGYKLIFTTMYKKKK